MQAIQKICAPGCRYREAGYRGYSIKVGSEPMLDAECIKASLAGRKPGEYFIVDANGGMNAENTLRLLNLLPNDLDFVLEAPCATWRECMSVRRRTSVPIIWDELAQNEEDIINLISNDGADGIGLKISKNGGLTRCRRQRDICIAAQVTR